MKKIGFNKKGKTAGGQRGTQTGGLNANIVALLNGYGAERLKRLLVQVEQGMYSDDDSLSDYDEITLYKTDPLNPDTDNDGVNDDFEVQQSNTDPNDPNSKPNLNIDDFEVDIRDGALRIFPTVGGQRMAIAPQDVTMLAVIDGRQESSLTSMDYGGFHQYYHLSTSKPIFPIQISVSQGNFAKSVAFTAIRADSRTGGVFAQDELTSDRAMDILVQALRYKANHTIRFTQNQLWIENGAELAVDGYAYVIKNQDDNVVGELDMGVSSSSILSSNGSVKLYLKNKHTQKETYITNLWG